MKQESSSETEESDEVKIPSKPDKIVDIYKGLYQEVYVLQNI